MISLGSLPAAAGNLLPTAGNLQEVCLSLPGACLLLSQPPKKGGTFKGTPTRLLKANPKKGAKPGEPKPEAKSETVLEEKWEHGRYLLCSSRK